ncbi:sensor histidine kinase [uncultured Croceitalea sp.]|uniref:sensor histidine kinase n=1 Tax=uncultured Croceitalea sp. TaxID=1798908 RepID=UPI003305D920
MNFNRWNNKRQLKKWSLRIFLVGMALIIIIFNDTFGGDEPFVIISLLYFVLLSFLLLRWIFKQIKTIIKLKNEQTKTELQHLKSQVNPHFFFNTLNNLYGLVGKDPEKAQHLILKLSDMMRYSIYKGEQDYVSLEEEVAYLKNYIELHKMRYHKSINIQFTKDIERPEVKIMPLLLIILLENAFKHGVENLREDAFVHINLIAKEREINFTVTNNFDASEVSEEKGIGLKNLKRRLELAYSDRHALSLKKEGAIFKAQLSLTSI